MGIEDERNKISWEGDKKNNGERKADGTLEKERSVKLLKNKYFVNEAEY